MERDKQILEFLAVTGGATSKQVECLIGSSRRYTDYILKRLQGSGLCKNVGRLATSKGGRPGNIWSLSERPPERSLGASILLAYHCLEYPDASYLQPGSDAIEAFESNGSPWRLPADFDALIARGQPCEVVLPLASPEHVKQILECQKMALRWSVLPHYTLNIVTTLCLAPIVEQLTACDASKRKTIDCRVSALDVYRIHRIP